uniref:Uncharacterized protein n=1 Tax=Bicosoecida sp. CB-2014 TaxID=1486930 RepID=A0A7S1CKD8_9STRA|mmetsp:Transcript_4203/g.15502  ORF Transcript_4203/g.15502 Transcript_4203/m.15502 type:complete len:1064 (+) Transcript_4203:213-3404(+)
MGCMQSNSVMVAIPIPSRASQCKSLTLDHLSRCMDHLAKVGDASGLPASASKVASPAARRRAARGPKRQLSDGGVDVAVLAAPYAIVNKGGNRRFDAEDGKRSPAARGRSAGKKRKKGGGDDDGTIPDKYTTVVSDVRGEVERARAHIAALRRAIDGAKGDAAKQAVRDAAYGGDELLREHALVLVNRDVLRNGVLKLRAPLDMDVISAQLRAPMRRRQIRKLLRLFHSVDALGEGEVTPDLLAEWMQHHGHGSDEGFTQSVFFEQLWDVNGTPTNSLRLLAAEFVLMVTTLCEMSDAEVVAYTFSRMADVKLGALGDCGVDTHALALNHPTLKATRAGMVSRGVARGAVHPGNAALLKENDKLANGGVSIITEADWARIFERTRQPWMPVLVTRDALRRATFGEAWWLRRATAMATDASEAFLRRPEQFGAAGLGGLRGASGYFHLHHATRASSKDVDQAAKGKKKRKKDRGAWRVGRIMGVSSAPSGAAAAKRSGSHGSLGSLGSNRSNLTESARRLPSRRSGSFASAEDDGLSPRGSVARSRKSSILSGLSDAPLRAILGSREGDSGNDRAGDRDGGGADSDSGDDDGVIGGGKHGARSPTLEAPAGGPPRRALPTPSRRGLSSSQRGSAASAHAHGSGVASPGTGTGAGSGAMSPYDHPAGLNLNGAPVVAIPRLDVGADFTPKAVASSERRRRRPASASPARRGRRFEDEDKLSPLARRTSYVSPSALSGRSPSAQGSARRGSGALQRTESMESAGSASEPRRPKYQRRRTSALAQLKHRFATSKEILDPQPQPRTAAEARYEEARRRVLHREDSEKKLTVMSDHPAAASAGLGIARVEVRDYRRRSSTMSGGSASSADRPPLVASPVVESGSDGVDADDGGRRRERGRVSPALLRPTSEMTRSGMLDPLEGAGAGAVTSQQVSRRLSASSRKLSAGSANHTPSVAGLGRKLSPAERRKAARSRSRTRSRSRSSISEAEPTPDGLRDRDGAGGRSPAAAMAKVGASARSRPTSAKRSRPSSASSRGRSPTVRRTSSKGGAKHLTDLRGPVARNKVIPV